MFPIFRLEHCASTNDEILKFLEKDNSPVAVYTFNQTNGRGQYGNTWKSLKDQNLAYSIALKVEDFQIPGSLFNFRTACILREFLANMTKTKVEIKWPNDIIIHGKKISGMLIEKQKINNVYFYIVGIGINVLQNDFTMLPKAGSLLTQTGEEFNLEDFVKNLHQELTNAFLKKIDGQAILEDFNKNLFRRNQVSVFEIDGVRQNGIIRNADEDGFLWVELEKDGLKKFNNKEIVLLY